MNADNLVILNGRLVREVELKYSQSGTAIANFTVAVNQSRKNANGEREADFINCVSFGKTAELVANYFRKGSAIGVVGEYQNNNYVKDDGTKVYRDIVKVDTVGFRESKRDSDTNSQQTQQNATQNNSGGNQGTMDGMSPFGNATPVDISDNDLPF